MNRRGKRREGAAAIMAVAVFALALVSYTLGLGRLWDSLVDRVVGREEGEGK